MLLPVFVAVGCVGLALVCTVCLLRDRRAPDGRERDDERGRAAAAAAAPITARARPSPRTTGPRDDLEAAVDADGLELAPLEAAPRPASPQPHDDDGADPCCHELD